MNLASPWRTSSKLLFRFAMNFRRFLPKKRSQAFGSMNALDPKIQHIYVINLNRQSNRWTEMKKELSHILDCSGRELWSLTKRHIAVDAMDFTHEPQKDTEVDPTYSLADQLFVEPQPETLPSQLELSSPIQMSRPEVAVARSHISIWKKVANGEYEHVLILEDDVWFQSDFASHLDQAWNEIKTDTKSFDILYLSYVEVKHGAPKTFLSNNVFRPVRGIWYLSGYVLSRAGAQKLLELLPCKGPVDLWINHQFKSLNVLATRRSVINQRRDIGTTNSYSILPALTKIGAITSEGASLFHLRPSKTPVFAFGPKESGLTSLAMALSMLGYRCSSDLESLPDPELERVLAGTDERIFDAYVNIGTLEKRVHELIHLYPQAKFIFTSNNLKTGDDLDIAKNLDKVDFAILNSKTTNKWKVICEHLSCPPPACLFPELADLGQRYLLTEKIESYPKEKYKIPKRDKSPWVVEHYKWWQGIRSSLSKDDQSANMTSIKINDSLSSLDTRFWFLRDDTFTGNLALFRPSNIKFCPSKGATFYIKKDFLGVREYSAAALTSRNQYLYGRFEAVIQASNTPGVVTGFFLHRDSPRQEIDIEITGNKPNRLLVNVFYNPGCNGTKFDYGYRGAASFIDLGFDASKSEHKYRIEWEPSELRWFVDDKLVHRRAEWAPTPIPHLPMSLHVNTWPSNSKELAGKLTSNELPATTLVRSVNFEAQVVSDNE